MALASATGIAAWILQAAGKPSPWVVTMPFESDTVAHAQSFVDAMSTTWNTNIKAGSSSSITLVRTQATYNDGTHEYNLLHAANIAGTGGTGLVTPNVAMLVKRNTGFAGRKNAGRMYWPWTLAEGNVDQLGVIDATTTAAWQTAFNAVFTALTAISNTTPAILHADGSLPTAVTSFTVENQVATQRRRLR